MRSLSDLEARPIPGTGGHGSLRTLVFSPDGGSIAFGVPADLTLKRIATSGGPAVTICSLELAPLGLSWGANGILFGRQGQGIMRVSPAGGQPEVLVGVIGDEVLASPQMLPGGEAVLFTITKGMSAERWETAQLVVQSLRSGERKMLVGGGTDDRYVPSGHLVYAVDGVLFVVPFDLRRLMRASTAQTRAPTPWPA